MGDTDQYQIARLLLAGTKPDIVSLVAYGMCSGEIYRLDRKFGNSELALLVKTDLSIRNTGGR